MSKVKNEQMVLSARNNLWSEVDRAIREGADPLYVDENNKTILGYALEYDAPFCGDLRRDILLKQTSCGRRRPAENLEEIKTLLKQVVDMRNVDQLEVLYLSGADVIIDDSGSRNELLEICDSHNVRVKNFLTKKGREAEEKTQAGEQGEQPSFSWRRFICGCSSPVMAI